MTEELNQDPYHIDLMRTLWENTYRGTVFDYKEQYVATIRLILSIPLAVSYTHLTLPTTPYV